jgi:methylenetetrahydrofolate dehydrogenase (NADP+) / methenyltetrahydrofolate cyclohydrolase
VEYQRIIDGKALAFKKGQELKEKITHFSFAKPPRVVDYCSYKEPGAQIYLNLKVNKAKEFGINFDLVSVDEMSPEDLRRNIVRENNNQGTTGIMIQVPLPDQLYPYQKGIIDLIEPIKDVDGLKVNGPFDSATGLAVVNLLDNINIDYLTKLFAVTGSEGVEGSAIVNLLINKGAKVLEVDKKNSQSSLYEIKQADVVISATGQKELINSSMVKDGVVLIDVGLGEFAEDAYEKASFYTPRVGGVGPMTIICLMENIINAATSHNLNA